VLQALELLGGLELLFIRYRFHKN